MPTFITVTEDQIAAMNKKLEKAKKTCSVDTKALRLLIQDYSLLKHALAKTGRTIKQV